MEPQTIFALASARGKAGVAVVRVSGRDAFDSARAVAGSVPELRRASLRALRDPETGDEIDRGLVIAFGEGESFTGENIVEYQIHGSFSAVDALLRALGRLPGLRGAEPGEFTRRALENGRMDLAQVEGLGDLIAAETEAQRKQALRLMEGSLSRKAETWRVDLVRALAQIEVTIDFADEEVPEEAASTVADMLRLVASALRQEIGGVAMGERIRDGFEVAILGRPNVGKSTLLNALAGREAAITSETAGTTRDVIEVRMDLGGLPVTLLDTAGLRESSDDIERIGVARAIERARAADLRVFLRSPGDGQDPLGISPQEGDLIRSAKSDLESGPWPPISGLTGLGVTELVDEIGAILSDRVQVVGSAVHQRHRQAMQRAVSALESAAVHVENGAESAEFAAEDVRAALRALDSLVGQVDVETVLDEVFSSFCLGK